MSKLAPALLILALWALYSTPQLVCGQPIGDDEQDDESPLGALALRKPVAIGVKIGRGRDAAEGRFPYVCSLRRLGSQNHACGGTLIHPEWVLTAAHCLVGEGSIGKKPIVYVGAHGINDELAEIIWAKEVIIHRKYTENAEDGFDIALVRLSERATKKPIEMPPSEFPIRDGRFLLTAGWGRIGPREPFAEVLQVADQIQYVNNKGCRQSHSFLQASMMCAYATGSGQGICGGDSGGPLLIASHKNGNVTSGNPKFDLLVGIVSLGPEECNSIIPDVFTRVSSFRQWIDDKIGTGPKPSQPPLVCKGDRELRGKNCSKLNKDLFAAAASGDVTKVEDLLSQGADASTKQPPDGVTVLHIAAWNRHIDVVEILISAGADVDADAEGDNVVAGTTALHFAAGGGDLDIVKALIRAGADVDPEDNIGSTPLQVAAFSGNLEVVKFLLESGADVNSRNVVGFTPLMLAVRSSPPFVGDTLATVQILLDNGADANLRSDSGSTALMLAAERGNDEAIQALIDANADPDIEDNNGDKAVDRVCACLDVSQCEKGRCGKGEKARLRAILKG